MIKIISFVVILSNIMVLMPVIIKSADTMIPISEGFFLMGSPKKEGRINEYPQHKVWLDSYYLDQYEVTMRDFVDFLNTLDSDVSVKKLVKAPSYWISKTEEGFKVNLSVKNQAAFDVTWYGADRYCRAQGKRLPTEAEWENACRAGSNFKYPFGNDVELLKEYGWYEKNSMGKGVPEIGEKQPNSWGFYDMNGNVLEWTDEWYTKDFYKKSPAKNPRNSFVSGLKTTRGGSRLDKPFYLRCAIRRGSIPSWTTINTGFRCAKSIEAPAIK
ncbi:MAG: formylglycine-generating enzyme family protein [Elusimicrobiota bacterium]|nr:formylglycine-generating enzyme family protein [Elusimicrobiota bacterium]